MDEFSIRSMYDDARSLRPMCYTVRQLCGGHFMFAETSHGNRLDGSDERAKGIRVPHPSLLRVGSGQSNALVSIQGPAQRQSKIVQTRNALMMLCVSAIIATYLVSAMPSGAAPAQRSAPALAAKPDANLLQLMRGVMYTQSNVIFAGQMDVSTIPHDALPAVSPNPLTSVYGGWQAVENASLALAESTRLLLVPGRTCANGNAVPVQEAAWGKYAGAMHAAALEAYKAAQTKSTDDMVNATAAVSDSCAACHSVYRSNRASFAGRCTATPPAAPPTPSQNPAANPASRGSN